MKYNVIMESGDYALILRGQKEYAVVYGLDKDKGCWSSTCCYYNFTYPGMSEQEALYLALDCLRARTEENYISRSRLEEIATLFKDGLIEADEEAAMEYFDDGCEMSQEEKDFFGIGG